MLPIYCKIPSIIRYILILEMLCLKKEVSLATKCLSFGEVTLFPILRNYFEHPQLCFYGGTTLM